MNLRSRVLAAINEGLSYWAAAARFGVAQSTANLWQMQRQETGDFAPKPQGRDMHSWRVDEAAGASCLGDTVCVLQAETERTRLRGDGRLDHRFYDDCRVQTAQ